MGLRAVANPLASGALPSNVTSASLNSITPTGGTLAVTGQASFAAGSAAAPSVKVGAEQNGLYSSAANTLSVALGGVESFRFGYAASAVNYASVTGAATDNAVRYGVDGSDSNIAWAASSKGSSPIALYTNNFSQLQVLVNHAASAVNYASVTGAATDNAVRYGVGGSDSNITWAASSKGTFGLGLYTNDFSQLQVLVNHAASAVNYASVTGGVTGNAVRYGVGGSDSNIAWAASSKGTFGLGFYTDDFTNLQFAVSHTASAVNYPTLAGATTGNAVTISGAGSDANIDFAIAPKGTGVLRFGTHSALAAETVTGYITIKDSAGNTRKLAVVS